MQNSELNAVFKAKITDEVENLESLWLNINKDKGSSDLALLCHNTLRLAESSKSRNAMCVWEKVNQLSISLNQLLNNKDISKFAFKALQSSIDSTFIELKYQIKAWCTSTTTVIPHNDSSSSKLTNIYIVGKKSVFDFYFLKDLKKSHFDIYVYSSLQEFKIACDAKLPCAIVIATTLEIKNDSAEVITELQQNHPTFPAVFFVTDNNDFDTKLSVVRAKGTKLFTLPIDNKKLITALQKTTDKLKQEKLRVLFISDDKSVCVYHAELAIKFGLDAKALVTPENILEELTQFSPDIIVTDMYMPQCSGIELAQVIRQDDHWAFTPIIFLSQETSKEIHYQALEFGRDNYYTKPIKPELFFKTIIAQAKHACITTKLMKQSKETEYENENQLYTMNQHNIVSISDIKGNIIEVNDNFCNISGYNRDELIGQNHRIVKSNYHNDTFYKKLWSTLLAGKTWNGVICNRNKTNQEYWVDSTIVPFLDIHGKIYKFVSIRTEITKLKESEDRYASSQLFANIGTWDWNIKTDELFWSENIAPLFGYKFGEVETSYSNFIRAVHPDDREKLELAIQHSITTGNKYNIEHRVVWPDGSIHWLKESGNVLLNDNGEAQHMLGVVQSLDAQKKSDEELQLAKIDAENANQAKSEFLSLMSHELRTPLNAIMGFAQLLQLDDTVLNDEQEDYLGEITKASDHLLILINEILDLSKIESGRIDLSIEPVHIAQVLTEAIQLIKPLASKQDIEILIYIQGNLINNDEMLNNQDIVNADNMRLKQVLINLMSNAIKYNRKNGQLIIKCSSIEKLNTYRIEIEDTGLGLSPSQQDQLFKPFVRLGNAPDNIEGTGIGLVITKKLIELMNGSISALSKEGVGSTFSIELPIPSDCQQSQIIARETLMTKDTNEDLPQYSKKVLYVEDNPANLRLVSQILSHRSHIDVITAHEPMLGLELAIEHKPDLILLDINLPGLNGFEVLKHIKQRTLIANTPVFAVSANAMPKDIEKGIKAGFDDYITKPLDIQKFLKSVDDILAKS
ncbi:MAG: response regulator [Colwellia sp.]|nr:response regulator [Colwellia sp.]